MAPIRSGDQIIRVIAISSDLTEQRGAHADRDRFFSISLDMLIVAPKGYLKCVNPAFAQTLGRDVAELHSKAFIDLVHPDDHTARPKLCGTPRKWRPSVSSRAELLTTSTICSSPILATNSSR